MTCRVTGSTNDIKIQTLFTPFEPLERLEPLERIATAVPVVQTFQSFHVDMPISSPSQSNSDNHPLSLAAPDESLSWYPTVRLPLGRKSRVPAPGDRARRSRSSVYHAVFRSRLSSTRSWLHQLFFRSPLPEKASPGARARRKSAADS